MAANSRPSKRSHTRPTDYKTAKSFQDRKLEATNIRKKYPTKIPVIVTPAKNSKVPELNQHKFLAQEDLSLAQFYYSVRKRTTIRSDQALFFFVENQMPSTGATLGELYREFADEDMFLYMTYSDEETFG